VAEPQRYDPEEKPDPNARKPSASKADWVVGAEEGLSSAGQKPGDSQPLEAPKLIRPVDPDEGKPREPGRFGASGLFRRPLPSGAPAPAPSSTPAMPSWDKGASSIPRLKTVESESAPRHKPPGADVVAQQREDAAIAARPHQVVAPQEFDIPTLAPPWWAGVTDRLRADRRLQAGIGLALLAAVVFTFWPRGERTTSIAHLKEHPERFADTPVRVGGRVSEVFSVGGSWAYTVVQGRDTIVVFSRTREPKIREPIVVVGTLSRGYLDGQSRVAIFESTSK